MNVVGYTSFYGARRKCHKNGAIRVIASKRLKTVAFCIISIMTELSLTWQLQVKIISNPLRARV